MDDGAPGRDLLAKHGQEIKCTVHTYIYMYIYNINNGCYCAQQQIQQKRVEAINMYEGCCTKECNFLENPTFDIACLAAIFPLHWPILSSPVGEDNNDN